MKTVLINGDIGSKVDGDAIAQELHNLVAAGNKDIQVRINSYGGSVQQGISVFSAIVGLNKDGANITTHVDGFAASIASIIAIAGKKVTMNDFARWMVHDAFFPGAENLDKKEKEMLLQVNDMLTDILSRRGIDRTEVRDMMKAETWINSEQAETLNLVDSVVSTKINSKAALIIGSNIPASERMALISNLLGHESLNNYGYVDPHTFKWYAISPKESQDGKAHLPLNNRADDNDMTPTFDGYLLPNDVIQKRIENRKQQLNLTDMNELLAKLGVTDETKAVAKVDALNTQVDTLNNKVSDLEGERDKIKAERDNLQAKVEENGKEAVKAAVAEAVKAGKIAEDKQESVCEKYGADIDALTAMLEFIPEQKQKSVKDQFEEAQNGPDGRPETKAQTYDRLMKEDPEALETMRHTEPEKFEKLLNAWNEA